MAITARNKEARRRIKLGMVGGGQGGFIGAVHRYAARLDDHCELVAGGVVVRSDEGQGFRPGPWCRRASWETFA